MNRNCPNCGAPYDQDLTKCPYCGTSYFDLSAIDFTSHEPVYVRWKIPLHNNDKVMYGYLTQLAIPSLESVEYNSDAQEVTDAKGSVIARVSTGMSMNTNVVFRAIPRHEKHILFALDIPEDQ